MNNPPIFDPDSGKAVTAGEGLPQPQADATGDGDAPPEFLSMSMDDARALMVRVHGVAIGKDDPILMAVTLHQGFCADLDKLLVRHSERIAAMLAETGNTLAEVVEGTLDTLKEKTTQAGIQNALALMAEQAKVMEILRRRMRRYGIVNSLLSFLSVVSCGLVVALVSNLIR